MKLIYLKSTKNFSVSGYKYIKDIVLDKFGSDDELEFGSKSYPGSNIKSALGFPDEVAVPVGYSANALKNQPKVIKGKGWGYKVNDTPVNTNDELADAVVKYCTITSDKTAIKKDILNELSSSGIDISGIRGVVFIRYGRWNGNERMGTKDHYRVFIRFKYWCLSRPSESNKKVQRIINEINKMHDSELGNYHDMRSFNLDDNGKFTHLENKKKIIDDTVKPTELKSKSFAIGTLKLLDELTYIPEDAELN